YFVWYYLQWGKVFRPQDIYAGNLLSAIEALDAGVTTTVDWSHGLQTVEHGEAAVDALEAVPGRFILGYGNIQQAPWEWTTQPAARCRYRPKASKAPARGIRRRGACASTTSRSRCRWTPVSGGAATCSRRCARRSAPIARASTWRRTAATKP